MTEQLATYRNGGFDVAIYTDGTKVRTAVDASLAPPLPEQMDLKITNWCDAACAWCHEQSTPAGQHADLRATLELLTPLNPGTEIAIGGGDPLSHPDFEFFVRELRQRGIIPSVTVNGKHFNRHRPLLEKLTSAGALFGVGVSYANSLPDWDYEHLVVHLIAGVNAPVVLESAKRRYKVLLLGYKQHGRGKQHFMLKTSAVVQTTEAWYRELFWVAKEHHVSFDNLAIAQLRPERLFKHKEDYAKRYMGQEGDFSMYIDAVTKTFALSSYEADRFAWSDMQTMFSQVRELRT